MLFVSYYKHISENAPVLIHAQVSTLFWTVRVCAPGRESKMFGFYFVFISQSFMSYAQALRAPERVKQGEEESILNFLSKKKIHLQLLM